MSDSNIHQSKGFDENNQELGGKTNSALKVSNNQISSKK
jgi:hypothetical protein